MDADTSLLSSQQAAAYLGFKHPARLWKAKKDGKVSPAKRDWQGHLLWARDELDRFGAAEVVGSAHLSPEDRRALVQSREPKDPEEEYRRAVQGADYGISPVWVLGRGTATETSWVYGFWIPEVEQLATVEGRTTWSIKIGRTDRLNPLERITAQAGTYTPRVVLIRTGNSQEVEKKLLAAFPEVKGVRSSECRLTNPDQIRMTYADMIGRVPGV